MTYTTPDHLKALTEYLADYIMEELGETTIDKPLFEAIQAMIAGTVINGILAFCGGASPTGLRYALNVTIEDANKPVIFEQWRVRDIREHMEQNGHTNEDLPTLFRIDDDQLRELLEYFARKGYSFYSNIEGLLIDELEGIAAVYFKKQP